MIGLAGDETGGAAREAFAGLLDTHHDLARVRAWRVATGDAEPDLWATIAAEGWLGARVPERLGGVGLGAVASAVVADLAGSRLLPEPLLALGWLPTRILAGLPAGAARDATLAGLMAGQARVAVAWQERVGQAGAEDPAAVVADAKLTGTKRFVAGGEQADAFLVTAGGAEGDCVWLVAAHDPGVALTRLRQIDGSVLADVAFAGAAARRLGPGLDAVHAAIDETRAALAVQLLGIAREALRRTIDYAGTRRQFGKPIGSFQALQHRMVDLAIRIRLGEVACDAALAAIDADDPDPAAIARLAAVAKAGAADTALAVTQDAIQLHGAIGYTDEADIGLYLAAALRLAPWLGTAAALRARFLDLGGAAGHA